MCLLNQKNLAFGYVEPKTLLTDREKQYKYKYKYKYIKYLCIYI